MDSHFFPWIPAKASKKQYKERDQRGDKFTPSTVVEN